MRQNAAIGGEVLPLHILITGTSTAISQITKSILERSIKDCSIEIVDFRKLALSANPAHCDCAIINNLIADAYFHLPSALNGIPSILITNNDRILKEPKHFGLFGALKNSSGGATGLAVFEKELHSLIDKAVATEYPHKAEANPHFGKIMQSPDGSDPEILFSKKTVHKSADTAIHNVCHAGRPDLIAIGASTGGKDAIIEVVKELPADTPPVVIVQHMPVGFTKMYADRLDRICKMNAKEAEDGDRLRQGLIILGHGSEQLEVHKDTLGYYVTSKPGEKVSGHCPSVDVLFSSVAKAAGKDAIGVILTGMGRDGASGLGEMKKNGAYTIGQDKESCVVYGMPCVAFEEGAVSKQAPLSEIKNIIIRML